MSQNILFIIGSPTGKKGNSESIADYFKDRLSAKNLPGMKLYLKKEIGQEGNLLGHLDKADVIILTLPIYQNSVPGLVVRFFEMMLQNQEKLTGKARKMLVITNSGFPEVMASRGAINNCRLFAGEMGFTWLGGFAVAPGTLIDGKKLEETGNTYKKIMTLLNIIAAKIAANESIPEKSFDLRLSRL